MNEFLLKKLRQPIGLWFFIVLFSVSFNLPVFAGQSGAEKGELVPAVGSSLRLDLLDTIRPRLEAEAQVKVKLIVKSILVQGDQARLCVLPVNLDGSQLDMKKSILGEIYEDMKNGEMDGIETGLQGSRSTLLKRDDRWYEVAWVGGAKVCAK